MTSDQHSRHLHPKIEDSTASSSSCSSSSSIPSNQNGKNDLPSSGDKSFHVSPTSSGSTLRMLSKPKQKSGSNSRIGPRKSSSQNENLYRRICSVKSFLGDKGFRLPAWLYRAALIAALMSICTSLHYTHTLLDNKARKVFNYSPISDLSSKRVELQYGLPGFQKANCFVSTVMGSDMARSFGLGALVLGHSFKLHSKMDPPAKMVLIYNTHADLSLIGKIRRAGIWDWFIEMPELSFRNKSESIRPSDMDLFRVTSWKLEMCKRVVWMRSDSIVMNNIDDLFISSTTTAESSQVLTSRGMLVFEPSKIEFERIMQIASEYDNVGRILDDDSDFLSIDQIVLKKNFGRRLSSLHWWYSIEVSSVVKAYMQNDAGKLLDWILESSNSTSFAKARYLINDPWLNMKDSYKRVALHLSKRHKWKTALYGCSWLQSWKPYGESTFNHQKESTGYPSLGTKFSEFIFGIWDDVCIDLIIKYSTVRGDFGPFNEPWCQPKEERNPMQELASCRRYL